VAISPFSRATEKECHGIMQALKQGYILEDFRVVPVNHGSPFATKKCIRIDTTHKNDIRDPTTLDKMSSGSAGKGLIARTLMDGDLTSLTGGGESIGATGGGSAMGRDSMVLGMGHMHSGVSAGGIEIRCQASN
jgi:hypothetical protein